MVGRKIKKNPKGMLAVLVTAIVMFFSLAYLGRWMSDNEEADIRKKGYKTVCKIYGRQGVGKSRKILFTYCYNGSTYRGYVWGIRPALSGESYSFYFNPNVERECYVNWREQHVLTDSLIYCEGKVEDLSTMMNINHDIFVKFRYSYKGKEYIRKNTFPDSIQFQEGQKVRVCLGNEYPYLGVIAINQGNYMNQVKWCEAISED